MFQDSRNGGSQAVEAPSQSGTKLQHQLPSKAPSLTKSKLEHLVTPKVGFPKYK